MASYPPQSRGQQFVGDYLSSEGDKHKTRTETVFNGPGEL